MIKKFLNLKFFFLIINLIIFFIGIKYYVGNKIIFTIYATLLHFFVLNSFEKKSLFFEKFLSIFIWFGFWFKLNYTLIVTGSFRHPVGNFDYSPNLYDYGLKVSIVAFLILIVSSIVAKSAFSTFSSNINLNHTRVTNFYELNRKKIFIIFIIIFSFLAYLNIQYSIYRKGLVSNIEINVILLSLYKWLTIFGLCSVSSFILFYEIKIKKNIFIGIFITIIESFTTSIGFLSRAMIFNQLALYLGLKKIFDLNKFKSSFKILTIYLALILVFFGLSMYAVNLERQKIFWSDKQDYKPTKYITDNTKSQEYQNLQKQKQEVLNFERKYLSNISPLFHEFWYLIATRWVGIDAVLAVVSNPDLNLNLFMSSLNQKYNIEKYSFYDEKFLGLKEDYNIKYSKNVYGITLPGFIAYSFFSGSYIILATIVFILYWCCFVLEYLALRFSYGNFIFSSLIGQVVAYRLIHFGYLPQQSYLLIFSIIFNILLYFTVIQLIKKYS